jgi:CTP:molybdopterin cytidylyltransferase MocA
MTRSAARNGGKIACIVLAAGGSRRLGTPKQLLRHRTRPLLTHAIAAARGALPTAPLIVVVGAEALRLRLVLRRHGCAARIAANSQWAEGLATSLRAGLAAAPRTAVAALILLVDQPHVDAAALRRLIAAWRKRPGVPAAASYGGRSGVPAVLPRRLWRGLRALRGDEGARALLRTAGASVTLVDMPEAALDIDTPDDVARLRQPAAFVAQLTQPVAPLA